MNEALSNKEKTNTKIKILNEIFEDVISDASELISDLNWGVKTYAFFGLISLLFGVQTIIYNIDLVQDRLYIPLFVAGTLIFSGFAQIFNYLRLRTKYSKLFKYQKEMKQV